MRPGRAVIVCALILVVAVPAQQPNSAVASLTLNLNDHAPGAAGPITTIVSPSGALLVTVRGGGLAPFLLASGTVLQPGQSFAGFGFLDLAFPAPGFAELLNGFQPSRPLDAFAFTNGSGTWQLAAALGGSPTPSMFGLQAAVADPSAAGGATITAATRVVVQPFGSSSHTFSEAQLGDDVTVTWYHQALSFPFFGTAYGRTHIDTNGYLTFGAPIPSEWQASEPAFHGGPPRIAPFWSDLHMSSTVPSAFGITSPGPASVVVTETDQGAGLIDMRIEWRNATEAAVSGAYFFGVRLDGSGGIAMLYGPDIAGGQLPALANTTALVGIGPGGSQSANTTGQDLLNSSGVIPSISTNPYDAIYEFFGTASFPLADFLAPGLSGQSMTFAPIGTGFPGSAVYQLFQQ